MSESSTPVTVLEKPASSPEAAPRAPRSRGLTGLLGWAVGTIPTLLVLSALSALAYWGHRTGWVLPTFSTLTGDKQKEQADWCEEHSVPESQCVECNPKLMPPGPDYGWCREHGVHQCTLHHPDAAQMKSPPEITEADLERARRGLAVRDRPSNNNRCPLYRRRIQFASEEAMTRAGVDVYPATEKAMAERVAAPGEIAYDQTRVAHLSSRASGVVWRVEKQVGDPVQEGEVLAVVDAAEVGRAKAELMQASVQVELKDQLLTGLQGTRGSVPAPIIKEARAALREARVRLLSARQALVNLGLPVAVEDLHGLTEEQMAAQIQLLGLPSSVTSKLDLRTTSANLLPVRAPFDGVIVERQVVIGEVVGAGKPLFVVADTSRMWLNIDVRQEDVKFVTLGQPVQFTSDGIQVIASGKVTWMSTTADEQTRTVRVRADLPNPDGKLRASTFGTGQIILRQEPNAVVVPSEAVQWDGSCHVVFVRDKHWLEKGSLKVFHTRTVRPGAKDDTSTEIIAGVLPGEVVATKGSGVLRAQLLRNNLGAG